MIVLDASAALSGCWRGVRRMRWPIVSVARHTTPERASIALNDLTSADIALYDPTPFLPRAWELRNNLTPYDAVDVALAEALGASLVTTDARIAGAPGLRCEVDVVPTG